MTIWMEFLFYITFLQQPFQYLGGWPEANCLKHSKVLRCSTSSKRNGNLWHSSLGLLTFHPTLAHLDWHGRSASKKQDRKTSTWRGSVLWRGGSTDWWHGLWWEFSEVQVGEWGGAQGSAQISGACSTSWGKLSWLRLHRSTGKPWEGLRFSHTFDPQVAFLHQGDLKGPCGKINLGQT